MLLLLLLHAASAIHSVCLSVVRNGGGLGGVGGGDDVGRWHAIAVRQKGV
jgi:hypothetical protein